MECKKCGKVSTDETVFATFTDRRGIVRRRGICWECRGKYAHDNFERLQGWRKQYNATPKQRTAKRERDRAMRQAAAAYVTQVKESTPCMDCGRKFPAVAMDFDHLKDKVAAVARMVGCGYKLELIKVEIEKCELVCACCHRIRTARRKEYLAPALDVRDGEIFSRTRATCVEPTTAFQGGKSP